MVESPWSRQDGRSRHLLKDGRKPVVASKTEMAKLKQHKPLFVSCYCQDKAPPRGRTGNPLVQPHYGLTKVPNKPLTASCYGEVKMPLEGGRLCPWALLQDKLAERTGNPNEMSDKLRKVHA